MHENTIEQGGVFREGEFKKRKFRVGVILSLQSLGKEIFH